MFSSQMKESVDGVIVVDDINSITCKELLRFMYQGTVDNLSECVTELYAVSDKYGIGALKGICEQHLYHHLKYENALEVFHLSEMHGSPALYKRSKEIIIRLTLDFCTFTTLWNTLNNICFALQ